MKKKTRKKKKPERKAFDVEVSWAMDASVKVWAETPEEAEEMVDKIQTYHLDGSYRSDSYVVENVEEDPESPPELSDVELLPDYLAVAVVHPYTHRDDPLAGHFTNDGSTWNVGLETLDPTKVLKELQAARPAEIGEQHPDEIMVFHVYKGSPRLLHRWISGADYPNS